MVVCPPGVLSIHIWAANLDLPIMEIEKFHEMLSIEERVRAKGFLFERDRNRFIVCHGKLRAVLGWYLDVTPNRLRFCYGKHGKPALPDTFDNGSIHFSLSHSEGFALYGFSEDHEIGVDIERVRDLAEMDWIAEQFFSAEENRIFRALPESQKKEAFFRMWTCKEAFMKATGDGLSRPLDQFEVLRYPFEPSRLIELRANSGEGYYWSIRSLNFLPTYACAVAVKGNGLETKYFYEIW